MSLDDATKWDRGSPIPLSLQDQCAAVAMPLAVDTPIARVLACSCPHDISCTLGLDQPTPIVILYFRPLTTYIPLQDIEQLTSLSSAGPHIWVFHCRMPPPLLQVQGCYTL